jgi:hypothetical protein
MSSTGDDALNRSLATFAVLIFLLGSTQALGAGKARIKWVTSVYADSKGVGLKYPEGVACGNDFFVVADTGNGRILRYSYEGPVVTEEAVFPLPRSHPMTLQVNPRGDIYFLDGKERRIVRLSADGERKEFVNPKSLPSSTEVVVKSFRIDADGNIYILDIFSGQVLVLDPDGQYLRGVSVPEEHGFFSDLAVNWQGRIFLLDSVEAAVYAAGPEADGFSRLTESLKEFMNFPTHLDIDDGGGLYLVDQHGSGLGLVGQDGSFLGRRLALGWKESGLYYPSQICISENGSIFIADRNNSRIQLFSVGTD